MRDFCPRECGTREQRDALTDDGAARAQPELYERIAELGWLGVAIPEEYGGAGGGLVDLCLFLEETARGHAARSAAIGGLADRRGRVRALRDRGAEAGRSSAAIAGGRVEAIAMSEPEAGSDVGRLQLPGRARATAATSINGQKTWISNAHLADAHPAGRAAPPRAASKHEGLTMFSVPPTPRAWRSAAIETMGGREVNDVYFTDCVRAGRARASARRATAGRS